MKSKPERHKKGWGYEDWVANNNEYCGKVLVFEKGKKCSYHKHAIKHETFYLESGGLIIRYGTESELSRAKELILKPGESFEVTVGLYHQMEAIEDSRLFEFSTQHFEEDSYRSVKGD